MYTTHTAVVIKDRVFALSAHFSHEEVIFYAKKLLKETDVEVESIGYLVSETPANLLHGGCDLCNSPVIANISHLEFNDAELSTWHYHDGIEYKFYYEAS